MNPFTKVPYNDSLLKCKSDMALPALLTEIFVTFVFTSVICNIKFINGSSEDAPNGFTVGGTLAFMIIASANVSGGCLNTAVGIV